MNDQINLLQPSTTQAEIDAVTEVLQSNWWGTGPKTIEFEKAFAKAVGRKYCLAVNSCTSALHLAVRVLWLAAKRKPTDLNIIVPSLTFVSTALAGVYEGVQVRFGDIEEDTLCLDPQQVKTLMDDNTLAVIPVHYGGNQAKIPYAKEVNVIEDCAHAAISPKEGKTGVLACYSFHPVKNIATGDMGAITMDDEDIYKALIPMRWCGINLDTWSREKKGYNWEYNIETLGFKYNPNDIMSALALTQLKRLKDMNAWRKELAQNYRHLLADLPIILPQVDSETWHLFVMRVPSYCRNRLVEYMRERHISPGVHYKPIHQYPVFQCQTRLPITDRVAEEIISLPMHADLTVMDQEVVAAVIRKFFTTGAYRRDK